MLALHPVLEPPQRFVEAVARNRIRQNRNRHGRARRTRRTSSRRSMRRCVPSPAVPIAKPAAAQMNSTLGLTTVSATACQGGPGGRELAQALHPARGVRRSACGSAIGRCRTRSAPRRRRCAATTPNPVACRGHPTGWTPRRKIAVSAARPTSQPARKARPVGRGRGVCSTSTAGMIDSGESATTSASGMSSVSTRSMVPESDARYTERPA